MEMEIQSLYKCINLGAPWVIANIKMETFADEGLQKTKKQKTWNKKLYETKQN